MINHVYQSIGGMYPTVVIPGGTAVSYSSNNIFVITKSQEKDGTDLAGWQFTININKSRYVRAKSKFPFRVMFEQGIQKYSGLLDIALEGNFVAKPKVGWYCMVNPETGELGDKNFRAKDFETDELAGELIKTKKFKEYVHKNNTLNSANPSPAEEVADENMESTKEDSMFD